MQALIQGILYRSNPLLLMYVKYAIEKFVFASDKRQCAVQRKQQTCQADCYNKVTIKYDRADSADDPPQQVQCTQEQRIPCYMSHLA